tara:strand:- start:3052 stop:3258 length:207 start_codon:yes stop_codon:yes gene_type:complete
MKALLLSLFICISFFISGYMVGLYGTSGSADPNIVQTACLFLFTGVGIGMVSAILIGMIVENNLHQEE